MSPGSSLTNHNELAPCSAGPVHAVSPPGPTRQDFVGSQSPKQEGGMDLSVYGTAQKQLKTVAFTSLEATK